MLRYAGVKLEIDLQYSNTDRGSGRPSPGKIVSSSPEVRAQG